MDQNGTPRVLAIIGSYRRNGVIDRLVDEVLASARDAGAEVSKIHLVDVHIEFCTNCRTCTQEAGGQAGQCVIQDDMHGILERIQQADALVLASPMNFWTVTAVTKRFIERLVCTAYWPWGAAAPRARNAVKNKRGLVVASSAAPAPLARATTRMVGLMKNTLKLLGARTVGVLFMGLSARDRAQCLSPRIVRRARRLGRRLAG